MRAGIAADQVEKLGAVKLVPGMPVEAFVKTGDRTALSYFIKPLSDQIEHAFREELTFGRILRCGSRGGSKQQGSDWERFSG